MGSRIRVQRFRIWGLGSPNKTKDKHEAASFEGEGVVRVEGCGFRIYLGFRVGGCWRLGFSAGLSTRVL